MTRSVDGAKLARLAEIPELEARILGEFVVRGKLGAGGHGAVYRAEQPRLEREVVVKVLHSPLRDETDSRHLLREVRLATRLDHPYAAHVYGFGTEPDGLLWIAMELVRGRSLARMIEDEGPVPLDRFAPLFERICEVVHTAHDQGIVHRDLKPANVMVVNRAGRLLPKLLDFGVARLELEMQPAGAGSVLDSTAETPLLPLIGTTVTFAIVGTPAYVAPEIWRGEIGDVLADEYALAILCYEALTGRRPFTGDTIETLRAAHLDQPVPPLGPGFPPELDVVLARGAAKGPGDRYPTVLAFATALARAAAIDGQPVPALEPTLRAQLLTAAPRPIAEAVQALDSGRPEALSILAHTLVRYLGAVALACQPERGAAVLARGEPDDAAWLELARAACRSFAMRPDAHPVPELVSVLARADDPLGALVGASRGDRLAVVEQALRATAFLSRYPLVVARPGRSELWMGLGSARPGPRALAGLADGDAALADGEGVIVSLAPFAVAAAPAPGASEVLFIAAGRGRGGAFMVAPPHGFERRDERLDGWLRTHGAAGSGAAPELGERPPYQGLAAFTADDADVFFGREREVESFVNRLRVEPFLVVVGASGAGKSSFVQAGVLPALPTGWRTVSLRPGAAPLAALAGAGSLAAPIVVVIDQLEELFTLCSDPAERAAFAAAVVELVETAGVRAVCTLRDDFLVRAEGLPALHQRIGRGLCLLTTPARAALVRTLVEPARRAGYGFDDPALPERMVDAVADHPGALALLSFTAARLWEGRDTDARRLRRQTYEDMGGVGGALAGHAEAVLAALPAEERRLVREAFRHLVTAEGTRATLRRCELEELLGGDGHAAAVVEKLVGARLLAKTGEDDDERVEIIHEALLVAWPRLADWRRSDADGARLRDQLRTAARQWDERGRQAGLLWRDEALAEYRLWRARYPGALTASEESFAAASLREAARGRRVRRLATLGAFVALVVLAGVLSSLWARAQRSAAESQRRVAESFFEQGRQALATGDPMRALVFLEAAMTAGLDGPDARFMLARAERIADKRVAGFAGGGTGNMIDAPLDRQARRLATSSGDGFALQIWDLERGTLLQTLRGHTDDVNAASFSADGARLLSASWDRTVRVWDIAGARQLLGLAHPDGVWDAMYAEDGTRIVSLGHDGVVRVWDAGSGTLVATLAGPATVEAMALSPDRRRLATAGDDGSTRIWDLASASALAVTAGHDKTAKVVAFSPDGRRIATGSADETVRIFAGDGGHELALLRGHSGGILVLGWSHDGRRVVSGGTDKTARIWDAETGAQLASLVHDGPVETVSFSDDDSRVLTAGDNQGARVWDARTGHLLSRLIETGGSTSSARYLPGGRIVTTAQAGTEIWDARDDDIVATLSHPGPVYGALFTEAGPIVTAAADGSVRAWPVPTGPPLLVAAGAFPVAKRYTQLSSVGVLASAGTRSAALVGPTLEVWDLAGMRRLGSHQGEDNLASVGMSPDGATVYLADQSAVRIIDPRDGSVSATLTGHGARISEVAVSGDGRVLASGSDDRTVRVWDTASGHELRVIATAAPVVNVALDAAGNRVVIATRDGDLGIWDRGTGAKLAALEHKTRVSDFAFSPDGRYLAGGSIDGSAKVWGAASGVLLYSFELHEGYVTSVAWRRDGRRLVTASTDGTARVWDVSVDERPLADIAASLRCLVPFRLDGTVLARAPLAAGCAKR